MSRSFAGLMVCAALLAGCSSSVPRLHRPDRVDAFCGDRVAIATAIESIVASTSDAPEKIPIPAPGRIRSHVQQSGGVLAHWDNQLLYLPVVAKSIGAPGDYVTLGDAAIGDGTAGSDSRRIYLTLKTSDGPRTFALQAFDVQDVCNEGKLKS